MNYIARRVFPIPSEARGAPRVFVDQQRKDLGNEGIEAREGKFDDVLAGIDDLVATHGFEALEALVEKMRESVAQGRKPEREELLALEQAHPDRKVFAQQVLARLLHTGKIKRNADGFFEVDDRVLSLRRENIVDGASFEHHPLAKDRLGLFLTAFEDVRVVEKDVDGHEQLVPLFYQPKTIDDAFSLAQIRSAQFRALPCSLPRWSDEKGVRDVLPTAHERVPLFESMVACALYHPRLVMVEEMRKVSLR